MYLNLRDESRNESKVSVGGFLMFSLHVFMAKAGMPAKSALTSFCTTSNSF